MRQEKGLQTAVIAVLAVAILVMSVGFALFSQNLTIGGTATFTAAEWNVHFDQSTFAVDTNASTVSATGTPQVSDTAITYAVTLAKPGDVFKFSIDVINEGTIDALLKKITITNSSNAAYIKHTVTYDGTDYTATADINNSTLSKEANSTPGRKTVVVTVKYDDSDAVASILPDTDQTVTLNVALDYKSA